MLTMEEKRMVMDIATDIFIERVAAGQSGLGFQSTVDEVREAFESLDEDESEIKDW